MIFGVFVLIVVCLVGLLVARLRNAPAGRMFIAVRSNERAASAVGIDVARTKLLAFGLSAFIAGLGGCLFAYSQQTISPPSLATFTSRGLLAVTYVAGAASALRPSPEPGVRFAFVADPEGNLVEPVERA